jgi:hypothetical protein
MILCMPKDTDLPPGTDVETWESVKGTGTVWLWIYNSRDRQYQKTKLGGPAGGARRIRISRADRQYNEEQILEENWGLNPFRNGMLRLVSPSQDETLDLSNQFTDDQLLRFFDVRDEVPFEANVRAVTSELVIRRLKDLAERAATLGQLAVLKAIIDERYRTGGTQKAMREYFAEEAKTQGEALTPR